MTDSNKRLNMEGWKDVADISEQATATAQWIFKLGLEGFVRSGI